MTKGVATWYEVSRNEKPSEKPSLSPSHHPSVLPSTSPSMSPTNAPSEALSTAPTKQPTQPPTLSPITPKPTSSPTTPAPTKKPSSLPSLSPILSMSPTAADDVDSMTQFYPDWKGAGSGKCLNDGNAPTYMKKGKYIKESLASCCKRWYSWDVHTCMGDKRLHDGNAPTYMKKGKYIEKSLASCYKRWHSWDVHTCMDWETQDTKCLNATEIKSDNMPDFMRKAPGPWLADSIEECCERYFAWEYGSCVSESGGDATDTSTRKWYLSHMDSVCKQDCPKQSGPNCGGIAKQWDQLYESAEECCDDKLQWIPISVCVPYSTDSTVTGSGLWYVSYESEKCVKDCEKGKSPNCGGIISSGAGVTASRRRLTVVIGFGG
ncbi:hypothetical protein ACHAXR_007556 [Thalassiosira sp. AJA248-18]